ncbi:MAG: alpha-2-macroglobulin family protein, partial [Pirellulales bacterium]
MRRNVLAGLVGLIFVSVLVAVGAPREGQWKKVDEAVQKGLPKTAIEELKPILEAALKEGRHAEAIKALGRMIALEGQIQGNKPEEKIVRMRAEIARAPAEMKPVLEAILANWFWQYYQQNRFRFLQRSQTAAPPGDDFTTWDLPRILREIDQQFTRALAAADTLRQIPIAQYDDLLIKGTLDDVHRPTLYDFLAHNALDFYSSGEQAATRAEDSFELAADGPIYAPVEEFVKWSPETTDEDSLTLKAVRLYQQLLRFHLTDDDRTARLDADLLRLQFAHNRAVGEENDSRYVAALQRLADEYAQHPLSSLALGHLASHWHSEGNWVRAHELATEGVRRFPQSRGGVICDNLKRRIEARELQISTEDVWHTPAPKIHVTYRNFRRLHFRVVKLDFDEFLRSGRHVPLQLDEGQRRALLARPALLAWAADLPATDDFQLREVDLPANADLAPGSYYLIASPDADFTFGNNPVQFCDFWLSKLAIVVRQRQGEGELGGLVLDSLSGEPVAGAKVRSWQWMNNNARVAGPAAETNADGMFVLSGADRKNLIIDVQHDGHRLATVQHGVYRSTPPDPLRQSTYFFTDRSIYRPGQTIQYKGLSIRANSDTDDYRVLAGHTLRVALLDVNGKEVERREHKTNDYGSFSGSFTAPRDRLLGAMRIVVVDNNSAPGQTSVSVEEYKRPKFQVTLDAPKEPGRLNAVVQLSGKATAYTGAAIDGAKVKWRVVRQVRYPDWWWWRCWWMPPAPGRSQEIAHGTANTDTAGAFAIQFVARPDLSVSADDEPQFRYTIYADVTDTAGETRSAQRPVVVGYTALAATLSAGDWQQDDKPVVVETRTTTLDGVGQATEGVVKVYRVQQPQQVQRPGLQTRNPVVVRGGRGDAAAPPPVDPSNVQSWPLGDVVHEQGVTTDAEGKARWEVKLPVGLYRAKYEARDAFGKRVTAELPLRVVAPAADQLALKIPDLFAAPTWTLEPGGELNVLWGTGYDAGRALIEVEHRGKLLQSFWTAPGKTQVRIRQAITEAHRGGFTIRATFVRENRAYLHSQYVDVPWTNKQLTVKWEHFVSKLEPNQREKWTAIVTGPDAKKAAAEMVAGLYDASLDTFRPHRWIDSFGVFRRDSSRLQSYFENRPQNLQHLLGNWQVEFRTENFTYRSFPPDLIGAFTIDFRSRRFRGAQMMEGMERAGAAPPAAANRALEFDALGGAGGAELRKGAMLSEELRDKASADKPGERDEQAKGSAPSGPDLSQVTARKNLQETAFFFPHLIANNEGEVRIEFTIPEALTEWNFFGFAHDRELRSGLLTDKVVTSKEIMVQPNAPRFVREGDQLEFTVKVSNQSAGRQTGKVRLALADARTGEPVDAAFGNATPELDFDIPSHESRTLSWRIAVPDAAAVVTYKAVGSTGRLADGEEGFLPVLSRRILVTESLPLPIRGPQTKEFRFQRLLDAGKSDTLRHQTLTVQMVSNPSWYAVMALPYLMEFPHECSEQTFNRFYANALARHIAASDPRIRRIFDQWKGTPALDSPLTKNQDLKAVLLEETPWVRQAEAESQARRNVGILFDDNRLQDEAARTFGKLAEMQLAEGAWPWFPGGRANDYITLYITTGFGRLRHLGLKIDMGPAIRSLDRLDAWADEMYRAILQRPVNKDDNHLSSTVALYLYCRSFYLEDKPIPPARREAVDYWLGQARKYWVPLNQRQSQGHLALALLRFGDRETAQGIVRSLRERSVSNEELGMFWRDTEQSWWWYRAPIETQALMIEAFDEVAGDAKAVEDCQVWLLKQKQTQDWKTTKATADAIYALLLRGTSQLASTALVEVKLGDQTIRPETVEAGTGFFEQRRVGPEIQPALGSVTLKKVDAGVAWGSLHWQYLEDMSKVTAYE